MCNLALAGPLNPLNPPNYTQKEIINKISLQLKPNEQNNKHLLVHNFMILNHIAALTKYHSNPQLHKTYVHKKET